MGYQLLSHNTPKARKEHDCEWCKEKIEKGTVYDDEVSLFDGEMQTWKMHAECRAAFLAEFRHYPSGTLLGFDRQTNDRGQPAKEDTLYEV